MRPKKLLNSSELKTKLKTIINNATRAYDGKPECVDKYNLTTYVTELEQLIEEQKCLAVIEALNDCFEFMGQFPEINLAEMREYIKDREEEVN